VKYERQNLRYSSRRFGSTKGNTKKSADLTKQPEIIKTKKMTNYAVIAQVIVALSIVYVWIFRFDNIVKEFKQYDLSDLTRSLVGASKIAMSTLLVAGIWYPDLVLIPSLIIAFLMVAAQYFHFKVSNPWRKHVPSLFLLLLCLFIAAVSQKLI
jgi:hypothetical protein